jgi:RNA polymerase sigma-70 factor (ECF subfamily)
MQLVWFPANVSHAAEAQKKIQDQGYGPWPRGKGTKAAVGGQRELRVLRVTDDSLQVSKSNASPVQDDAVSDGKSLVLAFQRGEEGACETIYRRYCPMVHAICWRVLGNYHDAQEASQETFLRVFRALPRFDGNYRLNSWITRIATNVCVDRLRFFGKRIQGEVQVDTLGQTPSPAWDTDPQEIMMRKLEGTRVERVLSTLPPLHRAVLLLRDVYGLPYREIATSLDISQGQVKNCLHRGRKAFRGKWMAETSSWISDLFFRSKLRGEWLRPTPNGSMPTTVKNVTASSHAGDPLTWFNAIASTSTAVPIEQAGHVVERVATTVAAAVVSIGAAGPTTPAPTSWQHSNLPTGSPVSNSPSIEAGSIRLSSGPSDLDRKTDQLMEVILSVEGPTDQGEGDQLGCNSDGELQVGSAFESPAQSDTGCASTPPEDTAPLSGDAIVTDDVDLGEVAQLITREELASESTGPSLVEPLPDAVEEKGDAVDIIADNVLAGDDPAENELTEGPLPTEDVPDEGWPDGSIYDEFGELMDGVPSMGTDESAPLDTDAAQGSDTLVMSADDPPGSEATSTDAGESDTSVESGIDGAMGDAAGTEEAWPDAVTYTAEELTTLSDEDAT